MINKKKTIFLLISLVFLMSLFNICTLNGNNNINTAQKKEIPLTADNSSSFFTFIFPTTDTPCDNGSSYYINWNTTGNVNYVNINLYFNDSFVQNIAVNQINYGYYYWLVPSNLTTGFDYQIEIEDSSNSSIYNYSNFFPILVINMMDYNLTITSPTILNTWAAGKGYYITWNTTDNIPYVNLCLCYEIGGFYEYIAQNITNDGIYFWTIGSNVTANYYTIEVVDSSNSNIYSDSDIFFINGLNPDPFEITSPDLSSSWKAGKSYDIIWSTPANISSVNINLYKDGENYLSIASDLNNVGLYLWTLPINLPSGNYEIEIEDSSDLNRYSFSDYFSITPESQNFSLLGSLPIFLSLIITCLFFAINIAIMIWINKDAVKHNMNGSRWSIFAFFFGVIVLILYIIIRDQDSYSPLVYKSNNSNSNFNTPYNASSGMNQFNNLQKNTPKFTNQTVNSNFGTPIETNQKKKFCPFCGANVDPDLRICPDCGNNLQ